MGKIDFMIKATRAALDELEMSYKTKGLGEGLETQLDLFETKAENLISELYAAIENG